MKCFLAMFMVFFIVSAANAETVFPGEQAKITFEEKPFAISVGAGIMNGDTTYRIGGRLATPQGDLYIRFPFSELIFPLKLYYGRIGGELNLFDRVKIKVTAGKNLTNGSGEMKDSDWGINYYTPNLDWDDPNSLDIYSESRIDTDAVAADISARYYLYEMAFKKSRIIFFIGAKYLYQKFDFIASDVDQWYPSLTDYYGQDAGHLFLSGKALTYNVIQEIPAAIGGMELVDSRNFTLDMEFGYSPKAEAEDEDHHLLRDKIAYGSCDGRAFLFSMAGSYRLHANWSLDLKYDYTWINTEGTQKQYESDRYIGTIDQKIFSKVQAFEMALSFLF